MLNETGTQVLSSILTDPKQFPMIADILTADDFGTAVEAEIWRGMKTLYDDGLSIDVDSLAGLIGSEASATVSALASAYYRTNNIVSYAKTLNGAARHRRLCCSLDLAKTLPDPLATILNALDAFRSGGETKETTFKDLMLHTVDFLESVNNGMVGIPSGIPSVDERIGGWQAGRLVIVAARPAAGKTALTLQMAMHAALKGFMVGICSLEMSAHELGVRALAHTGRIDISKLFRAEEEALGALGHAMGKMNAIGENLTFNVDQYSLTDVTNQIRVWVKRDKAKMAIVDHIGLVEVPGSSSANERIGMITRELKKLAKELDIPILAVSQLNRENAKAARMPVLSDLRDSGSVEQDADICLFLHRDESNDIPIYRLGLLKNRQGQAGWIATNGNLAAFDFVGRFQEFREITHEY